MRNGYSISMKQVVLAENKFSLIKCSLNDTEISFHYTELKLNVLLYENGNKCVEEFLKKTRKVFLNAATFSTFLFQFGIILN